MKAKIIPMCEYDLLDVLSISKHAHSHLRTRNVWQLHRAAETFVFLGVVVLQTNLKLYSFSELPVLLLGRSGDLRNGLPEDIALELTASEKIIPRPSATN